MKLLYSYLQKHRLMIGLALLLATINQVFSLLDPYFAGRLLNEFVNRPHEGGRSWEEYLEGSLMILGAMIGVAMISRIAKAFQDYVLNVVIQKTGARIYTDGLKHALRLPYQDFEDQRSGETLAVLTKVRSDSERLITSFVNILFATLVGMVFVMIYAASIVPTLPLVYLGGIFVMGWLMKVLSKKIKSIQKSIVKETTELAGATTESLRNIELIKSLGLTSQEVERLNTTTIKILGLELRKVRSIRTISFIQGTCVNLLRQVITFSLLYYIYRDQINPGQYLTLSFYQFFIFGPLQELGNIILIYRETEVSLNNMTSLLARPVERKPEQPAAIGSIERMDFEGVHFQHQSATKPAIEGISFHVKRGETIAFVGPSGAGKTTLVKLLVGLYHTQEGSIRYNGVDDKDIDFDELRHQIGFVTQDTQLFSGTIRENLLFVAPQATDEQIIEVLQKASCHTILSRADNGIQTVIGEGGLKLSGGERQRLSIARALLRDPRMIIFDEATSSLDSITEEEISQTVREITDRREHITIMIAHRLSTIMHADRIYVLERGRVVETGSHLDLLAEKGLYYAMWRQQIGERKDSEPKGRIALAK